MSKPILIIQLRPEREPAASELNKILEHTGLADGDYKKIDADKGLPEIDLDDSRAIIVGGSPYDITTPEAEKSSHQKRVEVDFINLFDQIVERDFPYLGICSGNGQLGNYCGTTVSKKYAEKISSVEVSLTEAGKDDPLLTGLPDRFDVLVGHKEACDETPPGSTLLATSENCPVQMFKLKNNIYATQFHPEADGAEFIFRIGFYKHHGYISPEEIDKLIKQMKQTEITEPGKILANFAKIYS